MKYRFEITGLDCPNCAAKLAKMMEGKDGITTATINFLTEKLTVETELEKAELLPLLRSVATSFEDGIEIK